MPQHPATPFPRPPLPVLAACVALSLAVAAPAAMALFRTLSSSPINWYVVGLETLLLIAATFGLLAGLGRFRDGPAIAMLCVGGSVLVAGVLSYTAGRGGYIGLRHDPVAFSRIAIAVSFAALACFTVWARHPRLSITSLWLALLCTGAAALIGASILLPRPRAVILSLHPVIATVVMLALGLALVAFLSAVAHNFIRSLEHGRESPRPADPA